MLMVGASLTAMERWHCRWLWMKRSRVCSLHYIFITVTNGQVRCNPSPDARIHGEYSLSPLLPLLHQSCGFLDSESKFTPFNYIVYLSSWYWSALLCSPDCYLAATTNNIRRDEFFLRKRQLRGGPRDGFYPSDTMRI